MSRLSMSRGCLIERPRPKRKPFEPYTVDPELKRGHLRITVTNEHDGVYDLLIDGRPAVFVTFEGELRWNSWKHGPLVDDLDLLLSLCRQMGMASSTLKKNFLRIWRNAEVVK